MKLRAFYFDESLPFSQKKNAVRGLKYEDLMLTR